MKQGLYDRYSHSIRAFQILLFIQISLVIILSSIIIDNILITKMMKQTYLSDIIH